MLIGRLPECDISVDDALVSRMHARVSVRDDSVVVEDLHSTNGVYVNGTRIAHSSLLREGDRLLVGTTEISLFEARPDARIAPLRVRREAETQKPPALVFIPPPPPLPSATIPVPASRRGSFGHLDLHLDDLPRGDDLPDADDSPRRDVEEREPRTSRSRQVNGLRDVDAGVPSTARADALEVIGALADRLASGGNLEEARRVLSAHLKRILHGATAGLTVPDEVCGLACRHALSLARWTGQSTWIDYVIELHLAARRAMSSTVFADFESAALSLGDFDRQLFNYYVESLLDQGALLTPDEQAIVERMGRLSHA